MEDKKEYIKLWLSYECYFEPYSDVEVGRLVRAMIKYKSSGEEPGFNGNERYIWPAIRREIDEASAAQEAKANANRENGKKGGRPKKTEGLKNNPENPMGFSETQKTQRTRKKDKDIDNVNVNNPPIPPLGTELGFGEELASVFDGWFKYRHERKADYETQTGINMFVALAKKNAAKYGESAVAELIQESMAANWKSVYWNKLEERKAQNGKGNMSGKGYVTAQQAQAQKAAARGPTREDLDRMKRLMATMQNGKEAAP